MQREYKTDLVIKNMSKFLLSKPFWFRKGRSQNCSKILSLEKWCWSTIVEQVKVTLLRFPSPDLPSQLRTWTMFSQGISYSYSFEFFQEQNTKRLLLSLSFSLNYRSECIGWLLYHLPVSWSYSFVCVWCFSLLESKWVLLCGIQNTNILFSMARLKGLWHFRLVTLLFNENYGIPPIFTRQYHKYLHPHGIMNIVIVSNVCKFSVHSTGSRLPRTPL